MVSPSLAAATEAALACVGIGPGDDVLVVLNESQRSIGEALRHAATGARSVTVVCYPALTRDGEEPPESVAAVMERASVIFAVTTRSLSHTEARARATRAGARIATMVSPTSASLARALPVDYDALAARGRLIAEALSAANACRLTTPAGTDLELRLDGRVALNDDGDLRARGAWGNLPAGEAFIAPLETSGRGRIVFDGALAGYGLVREPLQVNVDGGRAVAAAGDGADWLLQTLDAGGPTGRLVAELGIGTNPAAILTGNVSEDEKAIGTAHVAFGTNASFGGANEASVHIDGTMLQPSIVLDGRPLLSDGELVQPVGDLPSRE